MSLPLPRVVAVLFVVTAGLFVIGVNVEDHTTHSETVTATTVHNEANESGEGEAADPAGETTAEAGHSDANEGTVLGVDVESAASVTFAGVGSLVLAVGLWLRRYPWLAAVAALIAIVFAVFDVAEVAHQLDESRNGLALLAVVIATCHAAAALGAGWMVRTADPQS